MRSISTMSDLDDRFRHVSVVRLLGTGSDLLIASSPLASALARHQLTGGTGAVAEVRRTCLPVIVTAADRSVRFPRMSAVARHSASTSSSQCRWRLQTGCSAS